MSYIRGVNQKYEDNVSIIKKKPITYRLIYSPTLILLTCEDSSYLMKRLIWHPILKTTTLVTMEHGKV